MTTLVLLENRVAGGFMAGLRQPAAISVIRADLAWLERLQLDVLESALAGHVAALIHRDREATAAGLGQFLLDVVTALMSEAGVLVLEPCQLRVNGDGTTAYLRTIVPVPAPQQRAPNQALAWLVNWLARATPTLTDADLQTVARLRRSFRLQSPRGPLTRRLLAAAFATDVPWLHCSDDVYQFGWGANSRLLESTFSDRTPVIAARLARNKPAASRVFRLAGFPVAPQRLVASADAAVRQAGQLGWPVVIKPCDLDGGRGVAAALGTASAVRLAYERARQLSPNILLEKHIAGKDYRVVVLHGCVAGVWERTPGGVTGDGRRTVRALLDEENADPRRHPSAQRRRQIAADAEALELLEEQELALDAVPAAGRFVRLRRSANIATGGTAEKLSATALHPDNRLLCERAARLLRIDIAGIDLLMPDIGRSWHEGGAVICEINTQPQLAPEFPAEILRAVVRGTGRIPVAVVIADRNGVSWLEGVQAAMKAAGIHAGCVLGAAVSSGGECVAVTHDAAEAGQILLRDPSVHVLLLALYDTAQLKNGLPVDRCDLLVLAGGAGFGGEHEVIVKSLLGGKPRVLIDAASDLWRHWPAGEGSIERVAPLQLGSRCLQVLEDLLRHDVRGEAGFDE